MSTDPHRERCECGPCTLKRECDAALASLAAARATLEQSREAYRIVDAERNAVQTQLGVVTRALERAVKAMEDDLEIFRQEGTKNIDDESLRESIEIAWQALAPSSRASPPVLLDPVEAVLAVPCDEHMSVEGEWCMARTDGSDGMLCSSRIRASRSPSPGVGDGDLGAGVTATVLGAQKERP